MVSPIGKHSSPRLALARRGMADALKIRVRFGVFVFRYSARRQLIERRREFGVTALSFGAGERVQGFDPTASTFVSNWAPCL